MGLRSWFLESEKETMPVKEVMGEKYRELADWLHQFDLGRDELKETLPGRYQEIQDQIQRLDDTFVNEDVPAFENALERVRLLYTEARLKINRLTDWE